MWEGRGEGGCEGGRKCEEWEEESGKEIRVCRGRREADEEGGRSEKGDRQMKETVRKDNEGMEPASNEVITITAIFSLHVCCGLLTARLSGCSWLQTLDEAGLSSLRLAPRVLVCTSPLGSCTLSSERYSLAMTWRVTRAVG